VVFPAEHEVNQKGNKTHCQDNVPEHPRSAFQEMKNAGPLLYFHRHRLFFLGPFDGRGSVLSDLVGAVRNLANNGMDFGGIPGKLASESNGAVVKHINARRKHGNQQQHRTQGTQYSGYAMLLQPVYDRLQNECNQQGDRKCNERQARKIEKGNSRNNRHRYLSRAGGPNISVE
jgi:hypothetical protein